MEKELPPLQYSKDYCNEEVIIKINKNDVCNSWNWSVQYGKSKITCTSCDIKSIEKAMLQISDYVKLMSLDE